MIPSAVECAWMSFTVFAIVDSELSGKTWPSLRTSELDSFARPKKPRKEKAMNVSGTNERSA